MLRKTHNCEFVSMLLQIIRFNVRSIFSKPEWNAHICRKSIYLENESRRTSKIRKYEHRMWKRCDRSKNFLRPEKCTLRNKIRSHTHQNQNYISCCNYFSDKRGAVSEILDAILQSEIKNINYKIHRHWPACLSKTDFCNFLLILNPNHTVMFLR